MDIITAFLYPKLKETVYMSLPEGYAEFLPTQRPIPKMMKLLKCLYGLKKALYEWYNEIDGFLRTAAYKHLEQDSNLYISQDIMVLLYVDDILIFSRFLN